jgi:hypothetical protein
MSSKQIQNFTLFGVVALPALLISCSGDAQPDEEPLGKVSSAVTVTLAAPPDYTPVSGSLCAVVGAARNLKAAAVVENAFQVEPGGATMFDILVPAGNLTLKAAVYDGSLIDGSNCNGTAIFEGSAQVKVPAGGTASAAIKLKPLPGTASVTISYDDELGCPAADWDLGTETCNPSFNAVLSGGSDPSAGISVDDDLTVFVNGEAVFVDDDGIDESELSRGAFAPITLRLKNGDLLRIVAADVAPGCRELSPQLTLHHTLPDGTPRSQLIGGYPRQCDFTGGVFSDKVVVVSL